MGVVSEPKTRRTPSRLVSRLARIADNWEPVRSKLPTVADRIARIYALRHIEGHGPHQDGNGTGISRKKRRARLQRRRRLHAARALVVARSNAAKAKRQGLVVATAMPSERRARESEAQEATRRGVTKRQVRIERQEEARKGWLRKVNA